MATLRPALSVPPAYDQEFVICSLLVDGDLISWYVTCLVLAIVETVAQRVPTWTHLTVSLPDHTVFHMLVGKGALVVFACE